MIPHGVCLSVSDSLHLVWSSLGPSTLWHYFIISFMTLLSLQMTFFHCFYGWVIFQGFPHCSDSEEFACNWGDLGSVPGSGSSLGEGNGNLHQYSCLENSRDRGAWQATVHGVTKESDMTERLTLSLPVFHCIHIFHIYHIYIYTIYTPYIHMHCMWTNIYSIYTMYTYSLSIHLSMNI